MTYRADNTQAAQRFAVNPVQVVTLDLSRDDYSNGKFLSSIEGDFLIVESCDWPALICVIDQTNGVEKSIIARPGQTLEAPFKGITVLAPVMTPTGVPNVVNLRINVCKMGANINNESAFPSANVLSPMASLINTALNQQIQIPVPPATRYVNSMQVNGLGTTITSATISFFRSAVAQAQGATMVGYALASQSRFVLNTRIAGGFFVAEGVNIQVPSASLFAVIDIVGTGLAAPGATLVGFV
jgi:hypothetical protein